MAAEWWPADGSHAAATTAPEGADGWCGLCQQWCGGRRRDGSEIRCVCCGARAWAVRARRGSPGTAGAAACQVTRVGDREPGPAGGGTHPVGTMRVVAPQVHVTAHSGPAVPSVAASLRQALRMVRMGFRPRA